MTASDNTLNDSNKAQTGDFNLKHRLTGAGILISFGVVVLPWLLGSYSISAGDDVAQKAPIETVELPDDSSADNSIIINDDEEIKVFVSKIKPVDSKGRQIYTAQKSTVKESKVDSIVKPKSPTTTKATAQVEKVKEKLKSSLDKDVGAGKTKKAPKKVEKVNEVAKKPTIKKEVKPKKDVDQGYIVSVGVYSKKTGAEKVISDLKKKGFKPSSNEFESSKGLATRVWLGPFSARAAAGKERSKLEQVVGEKGLIIRYP